MNFNLYPTPPPIRRYFTLSTSRRLWLLLLAMTVWAACSTQKKRGEASWLKKFYHNTTAYYNGYFNANLLLRESIIKLNAQHTDNYTQVLDVYPYLAVENPKAVAGELNKAIEKVSVVATLHPVSHWVDDCYLMVGKSQYLKQDFEAAEETMEYFKDTFKPSSRGRLLKKDKKEMAEERARQREAEREQKDKEKKELAKEKEKEKKELAKQKEEAKKQKELQQKEDKKFKEQQRKAQQKRKEAERKQREKDRKKGIKTAPAAPRTATPAPASDTARAKKTTPMPSEISKSTPPKAATKTETKEEKQAKDPAQAIDDPEKSPIKPDKYFLKHRPCYQEGLLWLARVYIERQRYDEARSILLQLKRDPKTFSDVRSQVAAAEAHFYLKQKSYEQAIDPLTKALEASGRRKEKARYSFILGQIHQRAGRTEAAFASYEDVLSHNPDYEMEFNARLNMALNGKYSAEEATKKLKRMLDDIKNKEFLDQIYFTLAGIAQKNNDKLNTIDYLKLSLANNIQNKPLKLESYLQLARIFFKDDQYVNAKAYYDSTLQVITKTDDRYGEVYTYSNSLTDIAKNLTIIAEQDSLLNISKLSDKEKREWAAKLLKEKADEKQRALAARGERAALAADVNPAARVSTPALKRSDFFAYDDKLLKKAKKDFEKRFGNRKLEDNWRRSNKRGGGDITADATANADNISSSVSDKDLQDLLKGIPQTAADLAAANEKIMTAMFALGGLYRDRLKNNGKAVEVLEKMLQRYPGSKHELDAYYYLYLAYTDLNNQPKAQEYYNKILSKYPNTTYARVLKDPSFLESSKQQERRLNQYYDSTYLAFQGGKYQVAADRIAQAEVLFGAGNPLQARFALLNAMCLGNLRGKETYIASLKDVIAKHPETPEQRRAREILRLLEGGADTGSGEKKDGVPEVVLPSDFLVENDKLHYVIVVLEGKDIRIDEAKASVADFNRQFFKLDQLKVTNTFIANDANAPVILIRKFDNKTGAMGYYEAVLKNRNTFLSKDFKYQIFPVTQNNYRQILNSKDNMLERYKDFFQENYLGGKK